MRPYQIVVYGGSGFTGRLVCEHIAHDYQGKIRWAIAGRSKPKLEALKAELVKINPACEAIDILDADATRQESMDNVASLTDVMITTVGPFAKLGLPLVQACADKGTHYCDITGETTFVRKSFQTYDEAAKASGAKILHCCGYDSIPSDLSVLQTVHFALDKFGRPPSEVTLLQEAVGGVSGGTIDSAMGMMAESSAVRGDGLKPYCLDPLGSLYADGSGPDKGSPMTPSWSNAARSWTAPFVMATVNEPVVRRTNALLGYAYGKDFSFTERTRGSSYVGAAAMSALTLGLGAVLVAASMLPVLRKLLPAAGAGPSKAVRESGSWTSTAYGLVPQPDNAPPKRVVTVLRDPKRDPGYASTSRMVLETALCLALEQDALASDPYASKAPAGVLTPASALGLVLLRRLLNAGYTCETRELQS